MAARRAQHKAPGAQTLSGRRARLREVDRWAAALRLDAVELVQSDRWQARISIAGRPTGMWASLVEWGHTGATELPMPNEKDMLVNLRSKLPKVREWMLANLDLVRDQAHPCQVNDAHSDARARGAQR